MDGFFHVNGLPVIEFHQDLVFHVQGRFDFLPQNGFVENVLDANAHAGYFVRVGGPDAAASGADGTFAKESLLHPVEYLMVGGNQVGVGGNPQPGGVGAAAGESINFGKQGFEINDHTVAENGGGVFGEHAGGKQFELVFFAADNYRVPGVIATVGFDHIVD